MIPRLRHQRTAAWDPVAPLVDRLVERPTDALLAATESEESGHGMINENHEFQ